MEKLSHDENGNYYQKRMQLEREKRVNYSESRRNNRIKKEDNICKTYEKHMENENENINKDINNKINVPFEIFWNLYDKKEDRIKCERKWNSLTNKEREEYIAKLPAYISSTPDKLYRKHPATYLNNKSWENEIIIKNNNTFKTGMQLSDEDLKTIEKYKVDYTKKFK